MQISSIILYGKNGKKRVLPFNLGGVSIITGKSKTGKSVIGDIIDYCFGGSSCNIAEGVVREKVAWYALHLLHDKEYFLIARENPPQGQASTNKCCYIVGAEEIPEDLSTATPVDNESLEKLLSTKIGISENLFIPPEGQSRDPLSANIRHTLYYCIQNQDEIASQKLLFHRQSEPFMPQAIKDTLPYFLGIINEDALVLESKRTYLKREATNIRRSLEEIEQLKGNGLQRGIELLEEAKQVGVISDEIEVDISDYVSVRAALESACEWKSDNVNITGMDKMSLLQSQLEKAQEEIDAVSIDIRNTEEFLGQVRGYGTEIAHQSKRLESIGLFEQMDFRADHCPLCSEMVDMPIPKGEEIQAAIVSLHNKLENVSNERPHLKEHIDNLTGKKEQLRDYINQIQLQISAIYRENQEAINLKDLNARRGRVIGRISLWLESVVMSDNSAAVRGRLHDIEGEISKINFLLNKDELEERKQSVINRLSSTMSMWAKELHLEHSEYPYRLDLNKLTVMVDRDRPVPLQQLGSGSNWLGCHLIALFALHTLFRKNKRPVPEFLFLDQPSQVYYPPESSQRSVDSEEVRGIYKFIFDRTKELFPNMQVIVVDHADIDEKYFQKAIVENWWDGKKLVPDDWL